MVVRSNRTVHSCDNKIGKRIIQARHDAGISQRGLGFPGCTAPMLSRIEAGERWPSRQVIEVLAERLNVSAEWLAWGRGPKERYDPKPDVLLLLIGRDVRATFGDVAEDQEHDAAMKRLWEWASS